MASLLLARQQAASSAAMRSAAPAAAPRIAAPRHSRRSPAAPSAAAQEGMTGIVFQPFDAVQNELSLLDKTDTASASLARVNYHQECEAAMNEQINVEYNVSYVYHALYSYFNRDNVALPGFAKFFKAASDEERDHANLLMEYQNKRGGRVQLKSIVMPEMEFSHPEKGDALYGMELALSLEKLNFQKLRELHDVADKHGDAPMADFIEGDLLQDQVDSIESTAKYVASLRRVGKGLGVYQFDKYLLGGGSD